MGALLTSTGFENSERQFVDRFLRPGMTVIDVGAHHGYYTLLASKRVGKRGRVISFEPSPREQRALSLNLRLNRCKNVIVEGLALSDENGESDLYVLEDRASGCNSLKPPDVSAHMSHQRVKVARLDQCLANLGVDQVDFIKLDVEGGELAALQGAGELLTRRPRPVILAEVQDVRTQPWGYRARDILAYLSDRGYRWFGLQKNGDLERLDLSPSYFEGNFVAWPEEALEGCGF
jgi:FkbM family methyltransferase